MSAATVVIESAFTAGPTIKNTNAAPAETPLPISDAAIGIAAVEHTYIGNPTSASTGIASHSRPRKNSAKKLSGTSTVTSAETASPTASGFTTAPSSRTYPCRSTSPSPFPPVPSSAPASCASSGIPRVIASTTPPPASPVSSAASGRHTANTGPINAYVARIESTPVCGVEIRNPAVAPRPAPCRRSPVEIGITPHEQIGSGTPTSTARSTPAIPVCPPSHRITSPRGSHVASTPAMKNPPNSQGDIRANTPQ